MGSDCMVPQNYIHNYSIFVISIMSTPIKSNKSYINNHYLMVLVYMLVIYIITLTHAVQYCDFLQACMIDKQKCV